MEDSYVIDESPMDYGVLPVSRSSLAYGRLGRYQGRAVESTAMALTDMQCNHILCSRGIAIHANITGMAKQAAEMYPEAADRFYSLAVQNYCHLSQIIDDSVRRRW